MDNWVLCPFRNNSALALAGIKSILSQSIPVRIFAIDNDSRDNTPQLLESLGHEHIVTHHSPQLGVAGGWNAGLRYLFQVEGAERVLVVNQDVQLLPTTYEALDAERAEFVSTVSTHDKESLKTYKNSSGLKRPHPDFSCFLIGRKCYATVGPFDETFYPAWFEDNDYHIRAARAGIELYCIDMPFYHYAAGTVKGASEQERAEYYDPAFRKSREYFHSKWGVYPGTPEYEALCTPSRPDQEGNKEDSNST